MLRMTFCMSCARKYSTRSKWSVALRLYETTLTCVMSRPTDSRVTRVLTPCSSCENSPRQYSDLSITITRSSGMRHSSVDPQQSSDSRSVHVIACGVVARIIRIPFLPLSRFPSIVIPFTAPFFALFLPLFLPLSSLHLCSIETLGTLYNGILSGVRGRGQSPPCAPT